MLPRFRVNSITLRRCRMSKIPSLAAAGQLTASTRLVLQPALCSPAGQYARTSRIWSRRTTMRSPLSRRRASR